MAKLTDILAGSGNPLLDWMGNTYHSRQFYANESQRKAANQLAKLAYDLRTQMENRRQAAEEKKAEQAHAENLIGAGQEYAKFVYDATLQGMADPNVFLSGWSGVAKRRNIALTEPPPLTPEEVALIVKKAQGDKTMAEVAEKAKQAKAVADEMRKNEATWEEGGYKFFRVYNPETGALEVKKAPRRKASGGGGGAAGGSPEYGLTEADTRAAYHRLRQIMLQLPENEDGVRELPPNYPDFKNQVGAFLESYPEIVPVKEVVANEKAINQALYDIQTGRRQAPIEYYDETGELDVARLRSDMESGVFPVPISGTPQPQVTSAPAPTGGRKWRVVD